MLRALCFTSYIICILQLYVQLFSSLSFRFFVNKVLEVQFTEFSVTEMTKSTYPVSCQLVCAFRLMPQKRNNVRNFKFGKQIVH